MKANIAAAGAVIARSFVPSRDFKTALTRIYMPDICHTFCRAVAASSVTGEARRGGQWNCPRISSFLYPVLPGFTPTPVHFKHRRLLNCIGKPTCQERHADSFTRKETIMSSIGGISGSNGMMMQGMHRPDPAKMAENLFAKLDTRGQGYVEKSDLQSAFDKISSSSDQSSSVDELFTKIDTNSDGKVTKSEFTDALKKVAEELDNQFMSSRMSGGMGGMPSGGMGGMPPGGMGGMPPSGQGGGLSKDQLSSVADAIGSSNSSASSSIKDLVNNFDKADTDGDGKVSFQEAMNYQQKTAASGSSPSSASDASSASSNDLDTRVMMQIMKLLQAYSAGDETSGKDQQFKISVSV